MSITGAEIVSEARKFLGDPYVYGAAGPSSFDCSGLVQYALKGLGINAPRTSEAQYGWVQKISKSQLQPGDLIFEQWPGDNASPGHVVIYAGGGKIIQAPQTGEDVQVASWSPQSVQAAGGSVVGYGRPPGMKGASGAASGGSGGFSLLNLALPSDVLGMFSSLEQIFTKLLWVVNPENVARVVAGFAGAFLALFGIGFLIAAGA